MGHTHDDFFDAHIRAVVDDGIERGDDRFATFEGETFLADVFGVEETLE